MLIWFILERSWYFFLENGWLLPSFLMHNIDVHFWPFSRCNFCNLVLDNGVMALPQTCTVVSPYIGEMTCKKEKRKKRMLLSKSIFAFHNQFGFCCHCCGTYAMTFLHPSRGHKKFCMQKNQKNPIAQLCLIFRKNAIILAYT